MRAVCLVAAALSLAACGASPKRTEKLVDEVRGYGDGLRWRKPAQAALRLPPGERDDFLDARMTLEDELRISDYEIRRLSLEGPERNRAEVRIEWTWHMDSKGVVHETITEQKWERHGDRWILVDERRAHGEPMPGVAEPHEQPGEITESGAPEAAAPPAGDAPAPGVASPGQAD